MTLGTGDVPSTRRTTDTLKVLFRTWITSPDPKSWLLHIVEAAPRSEIVATTWPSPPSLCWPLVSDRSPSLTTSSSTFRSTMALRHQHLVVNLLRRREGGRRQLRPHGGLLLTGDG
jgi:hypothetical protein